MDLISNFLKSLWRFSVPGSIVTGVQQFAQHDYQNGTFGSFMKDWFGRFFGNTNLVDELDKNIDSVVASQTGSAPTEKDIWQAEREDTMHQRTVDDMVKAGVNPALMYGGSGSTVGSSAGNSNPSGIGDLLQLAMLPLQAQALKAQIGKTNAETHNINQRTRTEEEETKIRSVIAQYMPQMQEAQVNQLIAIVDDLYAGVALKESQTSLIHSQTEAQDFINQYLPQKLAAEIANISANTDKVDAERKYTIMKTAFEKIQKDFAEENHFLMSSSDSLQICVYIASLLGISTSDLTEATKQAKDRIKNVLEENPHYFDE